MAGFSRAGCSLWNQFLSCLLTHDLEEDKQRCKIFLFSLFMTNYLIENSFYKWGYLPFHVPESLWRTGGRRVGHSWATEQWKSIGRWFYSVGSRLNNVTSAPGLCPQTTVPQIGNRVFVFLLWFCFSWFLFLNPGEKPFLESLSRLLFEFPYPDLGSWRCGGLVAKSCLTLQPHGL